ncbi:MAG: hypothetical protein CVV27_10565 [Candidatus Melainabacteria bacterium HGW-Melainabacteria-1]|nr:MAG: hypothetical protein CVV27_10565 [Candidatus Melainabacteria bacterium HGW-Melainabacteria-1]
MPYKTLLCLLLALCPAAFSEPNAGDEAGEADKIVAAPMENFTDGLSWNVFVDTYYAWDFNRPHDRERAFTTQPLRHNEFSLNLGLIEASYESEHVRGHFGLQTGSYVQSNLAAEPPLLQPIFAASGGVRLWDGIWLDAGVMPSHIGAEAILSADNWTYSRSLVADYSPYFETGVKLSGSWGNISAAALLLNGWQNIQDNNASKALGTQLSWQANEHLSLNWSSFAGNEAPDDQPAQWRLFNDFYAIYALLPQLDLMAVFDLGLQQRPAGGMAPWWGTSLQARWAFAPRWALAGRLEYFSDPEQILAETGTPNGFQAGGASLNLDYAFSPHALWRIEGRILGARDAIFPTAVADQPSPLNAMLVTSLTLRFGQP